MEQIAPNWQFYGLTLAGEFVFGLLFAVLVRLASKRQIIGQTAFAVIIGVSATLLITIPVFGLNMVVSIFPHFIFSGTPMVTEYLLRLATAAEKDAEKAKDVAKDLLQ
jgi:hypothetical protein